MTGGKAMKINRILLICAATMIPQLVNAKLPFSNDSFGKMEGILNYCGKIDAGSSAKYQARGKLLVKDVPEKELTEARKSAEYKESYDSMSADLEKAPKENSVQACRAYLEGKQ
jgi:hypothetical protein